MQSETAAPVPHLLLCPCNVTWLVAEAALPVQQLVATQPQPREHERHAASTYAEQERTSKTDKTNTLET
jgi:hypothetical protein